MVRNKRHGRDEPNGAARPHDWAQASTVAVTLPIDRFAADQCVLLVPMDTTTMIGATDDQSHRRKVV